MKTFKKIISYFVPNFGQKQEQWLTPEDIHRMFAKTEQQ